jgi:hypothetical protein
LPIPGQQSGDAVDRAICNAREDIGQMNFAVSINEYIAAARSPPRSEPAISAGSAYWHRRVVWICVCDSAAG